jgi:hypothetical protein
MVMVAAWIAVAAASARTVSDKRREVDSLVVKSCFITVVNLQSGCKGTKKIQTRHVSHRNVWQFDENSVLLWRKTKKQPIIWETISIKSLHHTVFVR